MPSLDPARPSLASSLVLGLSLLFGLTLGGFLLGSEIRDIKLADRYVTVKGLVERVVKSDSAVWTVSFKEAGTDLPEVFRKTESDKTAVLDFAAKQGFAAAEITVNSVDVTDRLTAQFGNGEVKGSRYIVQQSVTIVSLDVDKVAHAGNHTGDLVQSGIALSGNSIAYKFNALNQLKPDMITEATRNARSSAQRFAADSGSAVGQIRSASQGSFSISAADAGASSAPGAEDGGGYVPPNQADSSLMKRIRVVATVDYYLK